LGLLLLATVMIVLFVFVEGQAEEPILPLSLLRNDIFSISAIVSFLAGAGMFGAILYISLFVQGVLGQSATVSGSVLMPTMLSLVVGSVISGQFVSRWGHYRMIAVVGLTIAAIGMFLLTQMEANTSMTTVILNMIILGAGLGTAMVLFTIVVQNAVDYRFMGVATAALTFFRAIGSTLGTAIFGSFLTSTFMNEFSKSLPEELLRMLPAELFAQLKPEALLNVQAMQQIQAQFSQIGPNSQVLFIQLMDMIRSALAAGFHNVFFVGFIIMALAAVTCLFLREIPLRRAVRGDMAAMESEAG
jgi:MFS family permease